MIFYTDDIRGIQGLDLILFHLHAIDTHLDYPISRGLDLVVQQIHTVSRSLHLAIRWEDHFFIGMARLGRGANRHPV